MIKELDLETAILHGCEVGLKSLKTGLPMKKPWRIETNNKCLRATLDNKKCKGDHEHTPCEGSDTLHSGKYPKELAKIIVREAWEECYQKQQKKNFIIAAAEERELYEELIAVATDEESKAFLELKAVDRQKLLDAARKVHVNSGHKPVADLARLLRKLNAPLASRAAMEAVKCSTCEEHRRPDTSPAVSLGKESVPFKYLSWDIKEVLDRKNEMKHKYLLIIDDASRFVRTLKILSIPKKEHRNVTSAEVLEAFETGWEEISSP
jgi:hypothetical protein